MKCFWVFAAGAFAAISGAQTTLWVGEPKLKEDQLMERASRLGQVLAREGKLVRLKTDRPAAVKKQFSLVLPGTAHELIRTNLNSVRDHVAFVKHQGKARPGKRKLPSFLSALEYFLRGRVDVEGNLRPDLWRKAIEQRDRLPKAKREWFGNAENVTGEWSYVGPKSLNPPYRQYFGTLSQSGRKTDAAYAPSDPEIIWTTSAGGGAWKSTNGGTTWSPKSDDWESLYTASVAIHPTNPDVVYIGTGDPVGQFSSLANGVMKTTDGGQTWEGPYGGPYFFDRTVTKIIVYPDDPSTVIATAANASTWEGLSSSFEGGIYRSTNSGRDWVRVNTESDIKFDDLDITGVKLNNGNYRLYASGVRTGGLAVLKYSDNRGQTWTNVSGTPHTNDNTLTNLAASRLNASTLYFVSDGTNQVFKSTNSGQTWFMVTNNLPRNLTLNNGDVITDYNWSQSGYDLSIETGKDLFGGENVYCGLITLAVSENGGASWFDMGQTYLNSAVLHNDQHGFVPHPIIPGEGLSLNDGGIYWARWDSVLNTSTVRTLNDDLHDYLCYNVTVHPNYPTNQVMTGMQDTATGGLRSNPSDWTGIGGGDGGKAVFDTVNNRHYVSSNYATIYYYSSLTDPTGTVVADNRGGELITPLAFAGTNNAYLLTSFNSRVQICTAPFLLPAFFIPSQTVTGNAMRLKGSPTLVNRVYTLDDSQPSLYRSDDSGNTFTAIDSGIDYAFPGFPTDIAESRTNSQDLIVTLAGANPSFDRVVRSTNGGSTWSDISGDLPMIRVNAVARDPHDTSTYYVGTDIGCFMTQNGGINWFNLNALGLPNAIVTDLVINAGQNTLFAATFGRGIWKIPLSNVRVNTLSLNRNKLYPNEDATLTITLNQAASPGTVVGLLDNSSALTTPALVTVPTGQTSTTALVEANDVTATTVVTITAAISGETKTISLTVYPYQTVSNLTFSPSPVSGGQSTTGTVTLAANAPKDTNVRISSSASSVQLPLTVTVPSGQRTKTFTMNTNIVNADETVTIEAEQTGSSTAFSRNLTIWQPTTPISHTVSPPSVTGGASATARVTLVRPAPSGGTTVTLSSNQAKVNVPGSILIASGATSRTYQVTTQSTTVTVFASLSATANGVTRTATLTLRP